MGLITPSPNPVGVIADFICSAINQNVGAYSIGPSAVAMERRVVRWLTDLCGYDENAGGNLTSGGMMANFIGLKLGRDAVTRDRGTVRRDTRSLGGIRLGGAACFRRQGGRLHRPRSKCAASAANGCEFSGSAGCS